MLGAGGGGLDGVIDGEATVGAAISRETAGALEGSGALKAGFGARVSLSPLRLPNTIVLHAGLAYFLARNFSIRGDRNDPFGFLVSPRPVNRCAICRNISVVR